MRTDSHLRLPAKDTKIICRFHKSWWRFLISWVVTDCNEYLNAPMQNPFTCLVICRRIASQQSAPEEQNYDARISLSIIMHVIRTLEVWLRKQQRYVCTLLVYLFWTIRGRPIASEQKRREPIEGRSSKEANMYARASSAPNPKRMRAYR